MSYLILVILVTLFSILGYKNGFIPVFLGIIGTIFGYGALFFLAKPVGNFILEKQITSGLSAYFFGGVLVFFVVFLFFSLFVIFLKVRIKKKGIELSRRYWISGGVLNGFLGAFFALFIIWSIPLLEGSFTQPSTQNNPTEKTSRNVLERFAGSFISSLLEVVLRSVVTDNQALITVTRNVSKNPEEGLRNLQGAIENPGIQEVFQDHEVQSTLSRGELELLQESSSFKQLFERKEFLQQMKSLGLLENENDLEPLKKKLGTTMIKTWQRLEKAMSNPRFNEILHDPEFVKLLEKKDPFAILTSNQIKEFIEIIFSPEEK